ncbi:hypothetical protein [Bacillus sp. RAR_GA_16]|uniref:hypothetical protein n=1 Tax=Bacillus sp. RAR_GA_16 TaxID=2876774 RepID=UPI001CCAEA11|nr:hypothetical protein [Bacillus sp. RAR_GA_16]MCA0173652.1 hypothetical protein [Bacillus sp. RAR_GA_16]
MNEIVHTISSPYVGTIEEVLTQPLDHVYEWEALFLVKTDEGKLEHVHVGVSGHLLSIEVSEGEEVTPVTVLGTLRDDLLITGSD